MTEASVEGILPDASELKGDSRLIILLGSPDGTKGVSRKLSAVEGVQRIRKGVFIVHGYSELHDTILQNQPVTSFIKTRKIPTARMKLEESYENRVYSIVSFSFSNPTAQQKKYVERLIRKTPGVRLRPGVILFPLLRSRERRRILGSENERVLIDSSEFSRLVRENGGNTLRWSRIRIINLNGNSHIRDAVERTLAKDLAPLEEKIRSLRDRCKDSTVVIGQLKTNYTQLSRSFRESKTKWLLAKQLWFFDAEKALKSTYNKLINTRRSIIDEEAKRST
nr:MAG: hypothetical protein AM325_02500 [Candidatus Thorarchaeota archaeon SMTZ1-45]